MNIAMLGSGFIARFYADSIQGYRSKDKIVTIYSRREESAKKFATDYNVAFSTTDMEAAIKQQQEALAQQKKDYVKLLRSEVTRLKAELGKATQKYEEITEGMSQAELDELHDEEELKVSDAATDPANQN